MGVEAVGSGSVGSGVVVGESCTGIVGVGVAVCVGVEFV